MLIHIFLFQQRLVAGKQGLSLQLPEMLSMAENGCPSLQLYLDVIMLQRSSENSKVLGLNTLTSFLVFLDFEWLLDQSKSQFKGACIHCPSAKFIS